MDSPAFSSFCYARSINKSLIELDLRNNDISHVGSCELATALKRNVTFCCNNNKNEVLFFLIGLWLKSQQATRIIR
ncbi:unnamed protein product [Rotaria sp. Silwood2]|nr:unnamed protein product [Rotaria sp. Silwood2]